MSAGTHLRSLQRNPLLAPDAVAGLQVWLKADALALSDGNAVTTWADSSANTRDATQATAAKKPTYKTNIVNGKPVVRFDGGDTLVCPAFGAALTVPWTTFLVCQMALSGIADNAYIVASFDVGDHGLIYGRVSDKKYAMYNGGSVGSVASDGWVIISATYNGASSEIQVGATITSGNAGTDTLARVCIGSNRDLGQNMTGDIAEVAIYRPTPTPTELAGIRAHLGAKYGVTVR